MTTFSRIMVWWIALMGVGYNAALAYLENKTDLVCAAAWALVALIIFLHKEQVTKQRDFLEEKCNQLLVWLAGHIVSSSQNKGYQDVIDGDEWKHQ